MQFAYVPVVIVGSALFMPWKTQRHAAWIVVSLGVVVGFVLSPLAAGLDADTVGDLLTISIDSVLASLAGHLVLQRQRRSMYLQRMQLRGLNELAASQGRDCASLLRNCGKPPGSTRSLASRTGCALARTSRWWPDGTPDEAKARR